MPSSASPLFCSWAPYCFVDRCLRSQLLVLRNFKLNPVIAQYSGEHGVSWWPSVRWMGINQSSLGQKTPGKPAGALRAQVSMELMSDFGLQIRWESVLLFLWCGDYRQDCAFPYQMMWLTNTRSRFSRSGLEELVGHGRVNLVMD